MPKITRQVAKPKAKKGGSVLDRIGNLDDNLDGGLKLNFYGNSGSGKTTLWATFPKPILAIVCSGGNKPGELRSINTPEYRKTIKQVALEHSEEIKQLSDALKEESLSLNGVPFKTIVLDHATGLQDLVLREVLQLEDYVVQLQWGTASQQQWGQIGIQMKERLRSLLELPQHVVIVAQQREFNADNESQLLMPTVGSALSPSVTGWLNTAVDYICQTFLRQKTEEVETTIGVGASAKKIKQLRKVQGTEYCLRVGPDPTFTTKFRMPKGEPLPECIVDADYNKVLKLINRLK